MNKMFLLLFALVLESAHLSAQPVITNQPTSQIVTYGNMLFDGMGNAAFSVGVSDNGPLTYQWQFNGVDSSPSIITIAGSSYPLSSGDGGPALYATFNQPVGLAVDTVGNVFISDVGAGNIRKIDTNGITSEVAGKSSPPYSGDGGAATNAYLHYPWKIALDRNGNIFIAVQLANIIQMVDTNGIITTVAGNGTFGAGGDGGPATNANLSQPSGVAVDLEGNLFVADGSSRIREVNTNGIINTVAGNGTNSYSGDGGAATNAGLNVPCALCVDTNENLFIVDHGDGCIRKVDANGIITTVAGTGTNGYSGDGGPAVAAMLNQPWDVAVDAYGNIFISDTRRVRKVDTNGIITTVAGTGSGSYSGDGGPPTNAQINLQGLALDSTGNLLIAGANRIRKVVGLAPQGPNLVLENLEIYTNNVGNYNYVGNYDVIVTGADGSVTSSVVSLMWALPPITSTLDSNDGIVTLSWPTYSYGMYQVEYTTNLASPNWKNLGNSLSYSNSSPSTMSIQDSTTTNSQRFYRVRALNYTNFSLRLHYLEDAGKEGHAEAIPPEPA